MPRTYGTTNIAPYATAPAVGPAGDTYYNTGSKITYVSDGTQWNALQGAGGGGGGAPYAPVTGTSPPPSSPVITPPTGLLWVDTSTTPPWTPSVGPGVPAGGAIGSYLQKRSATDYDTQWTAPSNLIYYQTIPAPTVVSSPYPIAHNLGTTYVHVQMWDSVTGLMVGAQVQVTNANAIAISVSQNMPNAVNVVVIGTPNLAPPINPSDIASKSYVDARTPNLPAPVTSGGLQSFTDALGDVWVAASGVYAGAWKRARDVLSCYLYCSTSHAIALNVFTRINFNTARASGDPYNMFDKVTNFNFVVQVAGRYAIAARTECSITSAVYRAITSIVQNGTEVRRGPDIYGNTAPAGSSMISTQLPTSVGDAIEIRHYASPAGTVYATPQQTWLDIMYMGTN